MSSRVSLNHIFRTVWNQALGAMVAVAETDSSSSGTSGRRVRTAALQRPPEVGIGLLALSIAIAWSALPTLAIANPTGGVAVVGQATFANNGNKLQVTTQNGAKGNYSAINWQSFSIPAGSSTYFQQPNTSSTSINRVVTNAPTQIFGTLSSNGNLVLVNQAGIAVGTGAVVDTNGFTASSLAMSDQDAMAGRLRFGDGAISTAGVSVNGNILARSGDVVLLGASVNTGVDALVQAPNGSAILAAGQQIDITGRGLEGIRLQVQAPTESAVNLGTLKGDAVGMFAGTLKHSGLIQATAATLEGGRVVLKSSDLTEVAGTVLAQGSGDMGGAIQVTGSKVLLKGSSLLDASGDKGGGEVLVGGGWHGEDTRVSNAQFTLVGSGAQIKADAIGSGNGGQVVVWSDGATRFGGAVSAHGGSQSGNGGAAEVSGKQYLDFQGSADLRAPMGRSGNLLLDPANLTVTAGPADINGDSTTGDDLTGFTLLAGTYPSANSVITAGAVVTQLGLGDVTLEASGNVNVTAPITYAGTVNRFLTINGGNITTTAAIAATNTGQLGIALGAPGGGISTSSITTAGGSVTLTGSSSVALGAINAGTGSLWVAATSGNITQTGPVTAATLNASAYGNISLATSTNTVGTLSINSNSTGGAALSFKNSSALILGTISTPGSTNLQITTGGAISQSAPLSIGGTSSFNAGSGAITLTDASNQFAGVVALNTVGGGNAFVTGSTGVNLATSSVGGTLAVVAGGANAITQTGSVTASTLDLTLGSGGFATLTNSGNLVGTFKLSKAGGTEQVAYWNNGALILGPISTPGTVDIRTLGDTNITQSAAVTVGSAGTSYFNVGYGSVVLANPLNDFSTLSLNAASATIKDANALTVSSLDINGPTNAAPSLFQAAGNLTLAGTLTSRASGDAIKFVSGGTFNGSGGTINLNGGGRWLVYLGTPGSESFPMYTPPDFKQYNATNGSTVLGTGNGVLYSAAPALTASVFGSVSKVYDGSLSIAPTGATISGLTSGSYSDYITSTTVTPTTASLSDPNVGTGKAVTVYGSVSGVGGYGSGIWQGLPIYGYSVSATGNIGTVTPARAIATINLAGSRVYDGTNIVNASIFSLSGLVGAETLALSGAGTLADKNVGTNKPVSLGTLALGDATGLASNYTLTGGTYTATITPLAITSVTGLKIGTRIYNGLTTGVVDATLATLTGMLKTDVVSLSVSGAVGTYADRHVGTGKTATVTSLSLAGTDGGNYSLPAAITATGDITPLALTSVTGITATKVYDGKTNTPVDIAKAVLDGAIKGDIVNLSGTGMGEFEDRNAGAGKKIVSVNPAGLSLTGADAGDYTLSPSLAANASTGTISVRDTANWTGGSSGSWSDASKWDVLPDGNNVLNVVIPSTAVVTYDGGAGSTHLNSLGALSNLTVTGGSLTVGSAVNLAQYAQTGGSFTGTGAMTVASAYSQTGGSVSMGGAVSATQASGNLVVGTMSAPTLALTATSGAISQNGPLTLNSLTTQSTTGTTLDNSGNHISAYKGTNTGTGGISVTTVGPLDLQGITTTSGDIKVLNFGGITSNAPIGAVGSVTLTANSPLTINSSVNATGNISLVATNQTSAGNITINGEVISTGGSIALAAASNYVQNGTLRAAQGVSASAGGSMTFGPNAITSGNPLNFEAAGVVVVPPGVVTQGSAPTDFVASFMSNFENSLLAQNSSPGDPNDRKNDKDVVVEGQSCTR